MKFICVQVSKTKIKITKLRPQHVRIHTRTENGFSQVSHNFDTKKFCDVRWSHFWSGSTRLWSGQSQEPPEDRQKVGKKENLTFF